MAMGIINGYMLGGVDMPTVAQQYDPDTEYTVGDYVINGDTLYKCIEDTTGSFDLTAWQLTNTGAEITAINSNLTQLLTATITSGQTSATIQNAKITTTSIIDIYFGDKVLAPTNVTVTNGQIVIEIDAQDTDTQVGVRVM